MGLSRRQFIVSAAATSAAIGVGAFIVTGDRPPGFVWKAPALGGEASVSLYGADEESAQAALKAVALEITRLERIFSLHQDTSELSQLNRDGVVSAPSRDLKEVLRSASLWRARTEGAFDPTVQRMWEAAAAGLDPTDDLIKTAGTEITVAEDRIGIEQGTALTLNGIAQGHIADRVSEILLRHGFGDAVINTGELRLLGGHRRAVGIPAAKAAVSVAEVAIATSEPKSLIFDPKGRRHHLIDPRTGESPRYWQSITVFAHNARTADSLSTAFAVLPFDAVADLSATIGDNAVIGRDRKGRIRRFGDPMLTGGTRVS